MLSERHPNHRDTATLPVELRRTPVPESARAWVARATGRRVVRVRRLPGASSAAVHALTLADGDRLVLRRYAWRGFLESEPLAPLREVDALNFAASRALPVPVVVAADPSGDDIGDGVPAVLMTMLAGRAVAVPDPYQLAELAAAIHAVDADGLGHEYFRWYDHQSVASPPPRVAPDLWQRALELWRTARPSGEPALIHRDFHPGNVLSVRGRVTGIVDWANACRGPWGCDVATCRGNLIDLGGPAAADAFTRAYEQITGRTYHPYWELARLLEQDASTDSGVGEALVAVVSDLRQR